MHIMAIRVNVYLKEKVFLFDGY